MFIQGRIAITATGVIDEKDITPQHDVMFIRPKMDYGTRQKVIGAAAKIQQDKRKGRRQVANVDLDVGAYTTALLVHNILGWQGPDFAGVACVPSNIERLDPDEPLVQAVVQAIGERNTSLADDDSDDEDVDDPNVIKLPAR